jgi:diguanylate cyclase (GGDEF)-like protein
MKNSLPSEKSISKWTYVIVLGVWLSLCLSAVATLVVLNLSDVKKDLIQYGEAYSDHLDKEMISSETILKGFSALFSAVGNTEPEKVSRYVRSVIETNNQIFALEIVQRISKDQLEAFIVSKRRDGISNFTVKSFSFDSDRKWQSLKDKTFYYPIVFMEPLPSGSQEVLGLDIESVPFLQQAMMESFQRRAPVATHPFRLVEGTLAYVVFCPIPSQDELVVDMVIDATKLAEPVKYPISNGWAVVIHHKDFKSDDPKGQLFAKSGQARSPLEIALFPTFEYQKQLATNGEPFAFIVTRQVGWCDLSLGLLGLMVSLTLISCLMLAGYLRGCQRSRFQHVENHKHMWKLANHDSLTGIPNRMLLMDRLSQALAVSERSGQYGALIFLDINNFKAINDTKGHDVGDMLLVEVAKRLQSCIRDVDTVARFGGDEFVVILSELGSASADATNAAELVAEKICTTLEQPCYFQEYEYRITASFGVSIFYAHKQSVSDVLKSADVAMYKAKIAEQEAERP